MTFEEHLKIATAEAAEHIAASLPDEKDCNHEFSEQFERRMQGFIDNWGKRKKHPVARRVLLLAAAILLAFGILMAAIPEVRAAVGGWLRDIYEIYTVYHFYGTPSSETDNVDTIEMPHYELTWVPEGYEYYQTVGNSHMRLILYIKDDKGLAFQYVAGDDGTALFIDTDGYHPEKVMVGNLEGIIYISPYDDEGSIIVWQDEESGMLFTVDVFEDKEILIRIAESVTKADK